MAIMVWPTYLSYERWKTPKYGSTRGFYSFWGAREGTNLLIERRCLTMPDGKFAFPKMRIFFDNYYTFLKKNVIPPLETVIQKQ